MRRELFGGIPDDEDAAVKAFVSQNKESALKTKPKVGALLSLSQPVNPENTRGACTQTRADRAKVLSAH